MDTYKNQASAFLDLWEELLIQSMHSYFIRAACIKSPENQAERDIQPLQSSKA